MYGRHFQQDYGSTGYGCQSCSWSTERGIFFLPCPRSRLRIWSRETGLVVPSRVSPVILHFQAESGAYSRDSSRFPRRRPFMKPSTAIGSFPTLSGHAIAYRYRSMPTFRRHRVIPVVLKVVPVTGAAFSGFTHGIGVVLLGREKTRKQCVRAEGRWATK